jgi:predicted membrane channel-forming protein YqfA (hemolysin III family)
MAVLQSGWLYQLVGGFKHFSHGYSQGIPMICPWLVVSDMSFIFHFIYGIILPIDFHIFQDGFKMVKTTNQSLTISKLGRAGRLQSLCSTSSWRHLRCLFSGFLAWDGIKPRGWREFGRNPKIGL